MPISSFARGNASSDDPVKQIRNLIRDLDAELLQLTGGSQKSRSLAKLQISKRSHQNLQLGAKQPLQTKTSKQKIQSSKQGISVLQEFIKSTKSHQHFRNKNKSQFDLKKSISSNAVKGASVNVSKTILGQPKQSISKQSISNRNGRIAKINISRAILVPPYRSISKQSLNLLPYTSTAKSYRTTLNTFRARVVEAYRNRRIFTVFGNYHTIRRCLFNRGWIEKLPPGRFQKFQYLSEDQLLALAKPGNEFEAIILSRLVRDFPAFFIWQGRGQRDLYADVLPYRNRIRRGRSLDFSTKIGLIGCTLHEQWYNQEDLSHMNYPRLYRLSRNYDEQLAFIDDFRLTQCRSLVRFIHEKINNWNVIADENLGTIDFSILHFALDNIRSQFKDKQNQTIDNIVDTRDKSPEAWKNFMINSKLIIKGKSKLKAKSSQIIEFDKTASEIMERLYDKIPEYKWDGVRNLWILKPGYSARGIGILIRSNLDDILQIAKNSPNRFYIAQKYIERPLLIYKTKFDIRQYLLVVINHINVTLWLYKDCYFRFSSQEYSMEDLRESIHLTNNCVQRKYRNKSDRDKRLPHNNMWSLDEFKNYLKQQNKPENFWNNQVFKGMKANLTAFVMASMEDTNFIPNSFELYGCDFMLDENYRPILIEINATPDLSPSTSVTKNICPSALRDLIKVIVDIPRNPQAPTGLFEKIFTINYRTNQHFDPKVGLYCSGKQMTLLKPKLSTSKPKSKSNVQIMTMMQPQPVSNEANITQSQKVKSLLKEHSSQKLLLEKDKSGKQANTSHLPKSIVKEQASHRSFNDREQPLKQTNMVTHSKSTIQESPSIKLVDDKENTIKQSEAIQLAKSFVNEQPSLKSLNDKDHLGKKVSFKFKFLRSFKKLKSPLKRSKKETILETNSSSIDVKPSFKNQLKSITKEALALQYTQPL